MPVASGGSYHDRLASGGARAPVSPRVKVAERMKRKHIIILAGTLAVAATMMAIFAVRWWRRQHSFAGYVFQAPVVAPATPARIRLLPVAVGFDRPTDVQFVPGGG